ncbi:hypothetical protein [Streptomyces colonosanans]|uniref:Uncharacterized protein n=1 Tax=Streptomyces colonosanans TaxID=1428652 RepID=A0A1S2PR48_9ACTN|nr:hypothetical protein [Streptomyces colonosanans]OIJ95404.1 hypothetical protein BIV24_08975 [Streptomyces colonosanans]
MTPSIATSAALDSQNEALLTRAAELEALWYTGPRMWHGSSGEPVTGLQAATHLETALGVLDREGWEPGAFGLWEVLAGPVDLTGVSVSVLELVICAHTGASAAEPRLWDKVPGRTVDQVRALLLAGAAYARRYGPTDAARH